MTPHLRFINKLFLNSKAQKKMYVITTRFLVRKKLWKRIHRTMDARKKPSILWVATGAATLTHHEPAIMRYTLRGAAGLFHAGSESGYFTDSGVASIRIGIER